MKKYVIDCRMMKDKETAHEYLKERFSFPEYYGKNLDALYDCLTELPSCKIKLEYPWELSALGEYAGKVLAAFCDASRNTGKIKLI